MPLDKPPFACRADSEIPERGGINIRFGENICCVDGCGIREALMLKYPTTINIHTLKITVQFGFCKMHEELFCRATAALCRATATPDPSPTKEPKL